MNIGTVARRVFAGLAIATIATLIAAPVSASAAVIPDPGEPTSSHTVTADDPVFCPLQRVGTHWARCDVLTGGNMTPAANSAPVASAPDTAANGEVPSVGLECPLRRVGSHLVRCDVVIGGGDAPAFIPEL